MNQRIEQAMTTLQEIEEAVYADSASLPLSLDHDEVQLQTWLERRDRRIANAVAIYCAQLHTTGIEIKDCLFTSSASTENTRPIADWAPFGLTGADLFVCGVLAASCGRLDADRVCAAINAAYQKRREEEK
jgi:hypothetical protein